jgi:hypothetical protein
LAPAAALAAATSRFRARHASSSALLSPPASGEATSASIAARAAALGHMRLTDKAHSGFEGLVPKLCTHDIIALRSY